MWGVPAPSPPMCVWLLDSITLVQIGRTLRQTANSTCVMVDGGIRSESPAAVQDTTSVLICKNTVLIWYEFHFRYVLCIYAVAECFCRKKLCSCPQEGSRMGYKGRFFQIVDFLRIMMSFLFLRSGATVLHEIKKQWKKKSNNFVFLATPGSCLCSCIHLFIWDASSVHVEVFLKHKANGASAFCHQGVAHQSASNVTQPSTTVNYLQVLRKQGLFSSKSWQGSNKNNWNLWKNKGS